MIASEIVADTSPLIAFKYAEAMDVLKSLFKMVVVPPAVWRELTVKEKEFFESLDFVVVKNPSDRRLVNALQLMVDEGEAEAIVLALERKSKLMIDDLRGRKTSKKMRVSVLGVLGVLKLAKRSGVVKKVKPLIEKMISKGYYISRELVEKFLEDLGEV